MWWTVAGVVGALGVILGAFGAHGLEGVVDAEGMERWHTASKYHLIHAVALLGVAAHPRKPSVAGVLFTVGIAIFAGTLYLLAVTGVGVLGAITPIGGLCLIAGWVALAAWPRTPRAGGGSDPVS